MHHGLENPPVRSQGALPRIASLVLASLPKSAVAPAVAAILIAGPVLAASAKPSEIDIKVLVSVPNGPIAAGGEGEAVVTLTAPSGVHINRYPPIRLTVEPNPPISFPQATLKVGLDAMPKNMDENSFDTVDPIHLKFHVERHRSDGSIPIKGKLRYTYCVKRSGFCAPGTKDISFTVPVSAQP